MHRILPATYGKQSPAQNLPSVSNSHHTHLLRDDGGLAMNETGLIHFDHALHASRAWVHDLMEELNWRDEHCSYQALRSVLHALRDHLPIEDVIALGGEMPMFVRGSYYEGWHPKTHGPYKKAKKKDFLARVAEHVRQDRHDPACDPERLTHGVFKTLTRHVSRREIEKIKERLPEEIGFLFDSQRVI
jgi:uncharacterized protein (DUF2267 family)